jgi:hypothetical protein
MFRAKISPEIFLNTVFTGSEMFVGVPNSGIFVPVFDWG